MGWAGLKYVVCILVPILVQVGKLKSCLEEERHALLELGSYMKSKNEGPSSYLQDFGQFEREKTYNCCAWERVRCNPTTQRVTELHLGSMVYRHSSIIAKGRFGSPWLFNVSLFRPFKELRSLDLSDNSLTGLVEKDELANMEELQILDLSGNKMQGHIQDFCAFRNLRELNLGSNLFYGGLPSCFYNMSSLQILDLSSNNLTEKLLPNLFSNLTFLESLSLSNNHFEGQLFLSSLANLSKLHTLELSRSGLEVQTEDSLWKPMFHLQYLDIQSCNLNKPNGTMPKFLKHQYNLRAVDLAYNNLVGSFPTWLLNNNPQLEYLCLMNNYLTGSLHSPTHTNSFLYYLDISSNNFRGKVAKNIGYVFPNLTYLNMSGNQLEGHIPASISDMKILTFLDLSGNNFCGELPGRLFNHCQSIHYLKVSDNKLQGEIIPEHMNMTGLFVLDASNNNFSGTIKDSLQRSSLLLSLDISNNGIQGQLPRWISNLTGLRSMLAPKNILQGHIPEELCKLKLQYLVLSQNNFTGPLPSCSNFSSLNFLHLHKNSLSGSIPNALSSCSSLQAMDLTDNMFYGRIPSWINKISKLRVLQLGGNNLHGRIPYQICQLPYLDILDLSRNRLHGEIPACLQSMPFGLRITEQDSNDPELFRFGFSDEMSRFGFSDEMTSRYQVLDMVEVLVKNQYLSYEGGGHLYMSALDLSRNYLSGVIPLELGNLSQIQAINLSHNCLFGSIPITFANLKQIESLDLSYNNLTGFIPSQLVELYYLAIFNVSFNNLTGSTPDSGQFANFDQSNYIRNPGLCGLAVNKSCHTINALPHIAGKNDQGEGDEAIDMIGFFWCFGMSSIVAFLATILILYLNPQWCRVWFNFADWHFLWWLP